MNEKIMGVEHFGAVLSSAVSTSDPRCSQDCYESYKALYAENESLKNAANEQAAHSDKILRFANETAKENESLKKRLAEDVAAFEFLRCGGVDGLNGFSDGYISLIGDEVRTNLKNPRYKQGFDHGLLCCPMLRKGSPQEEGRE